MIPEKLSERLGITSPVAHHLLTSPLGSPGTAPRLLAGGGGAGVGSYKKQYTKNKDTILLPHLKDAGKSVYTAKAFSPIVTKCHSLFPPDLHHVKAAAQTSVVAGAPIASGSQSSGLGIGSMANRGLLLGSLNPPIEAFRGAPGMRVSIK